MGVLNSVSLKFTVDNEIFESQMKIIWTYLSKTYHNIQSVTFVCSFMCHLTDTRSSFFFFFFLMLNRVAVNYEDKTCRRMNASKNSTKSRSTLEDELIVNWSQQLWSHCVSLRKYKKKTTSNSFCLGDEMEAVLNFSIVTLFCMELLQFPIVKFVLLICFRILFL